MICNGGHGGGPCASCRELDPAIRGQRDPGPPTLDELLAGIPRDIERLEVKRDRAIALMNQYRGDVSGSHATALARACGARVRGLQEDLAMWRTYASAHPGSGKALIGVGYHCEHGRGQGRHPKCWDGEARRYFNPGMAVRQREPGDDDGELVERYP
jgi:hypothetical protein